jgi:hypothetical protein
VPSQRTTHAKLQRDRAKKAKAESKRSRRLDRAAEAEAPVEEPTAADPAAEPEDQVSAAALLRSVEEAHRQLQAGTISLEEFEERKSDLLGRLPID